MALLENAHDFLNESLRCSALADEEPREWKFAVLHVVQAIELLLKARLEAEHPVLVFEDVDRRRRAVSMTQAVDRIVNVAGIRLSSREQRSIRKARGWRDAIVHHSFEMSAYEVESVYVQLFEFLVRFHDEHTAFGTLHSYVRPELWWREAELFEFFKREFVVYDGRTMIRHWPSEIVAAQELKAIELYASEYARIAYGDEPGYDHALIREECHDCGVKIGELHVPNCDVENCPRCFGQIITCGCLWTEGPAETALEEREVVATRVRGYFQVDPSPTVIDSAADTSSSDR